MARCDPPKKNTSNKKEVKNTVIVEAEEEAEALWNRVLFHTNV